MLAPYTHTFTSEPLAWGTATTIDTTEPGDWDAGVYDPPVPYEFSQPWTPAEISAARMGQVGQVYILVPNIPDDAPDWVHDKWARKTYIGWSQAAQARIEAHTKGRSGVKYIRVAVEDGVTWEPAFVVEGVTRCYESALKARKNGRAVLEAMYKYA